MAKNQSGRILTDSVNMQSAVLLKWKRRAVYVRCYNDNSLFCNSRLISKASY